MESPTHLIPKLLEICQQAAKAILEVYESDDLQVSNKIDNSPVTQADLAAHRIICDALGKLTPDIPLLSEEAADIPFTQRQGWSQFWCIDPLDGTKEFIRRNGDFTINIALIADHKPILGMVYIPISSTAYWGSSDGGAWKQIQNQPATAIHCRTLGNQLSIVASRRHGQEQNDKLLQPLSQHFNKIILLHRGSSLKMCLIAEGLVDFCPRLFPTSEWDTAAAQAIVEAAGGILVNAESLKPLTYNTQESLINPFFFVCGDPKFPLHNLASPNIDQQNS